jgi:1-aminocyclopropane-1-carboxylate deaminase/D-cysteine desulfhydrase-like pyridoxal-dependent ACC family enzyme
VATALATLMSTPIVTLAPHPTPVDELARLRASLGPSCPRLLMKRDDLLSFGGGGNKVRKMQAVAAEALAVQSNHARVTAAAGAVLGIPVTLVLNGIAPASPTGNARLDALFGATIRYVATRDERTPMMERVADEARAAGERPFIVPLGASTPTGAIGFARGVAELGTVRPDVIVHATSSGGTQAGLIAGCALLGMRADVLGISADDPAAALRETISALLDGMAGRLGARAATVGGDRAIEVDDTQVGEGYGIPTPASTGAAALVARTEGIVLDPVYTAKAMAGLMARIRAQAFSPAATVLFWHTGGLPGYFA